MHTQDFASRPAYLPVSDYNAPVSRGDGIVPLESCSKGGVPRRTSSLLHWVEPPRAAPSSAVGIGIRWRSHFVSRGFFSVLVNHVGKDICLLGFLTRERHKAAGLRFWLSLQTLKHSEIIPVFPNLLFETAQWRNPHAAAAAALDKFLFTVNK